MPRSSKIYKSDNLCKTYVINKSMDFINVYINKANHKREQD